MRRFFIAIGMVLVASAPAIAQGSRSASKPSRPLKPASAANTGKKQPAQSVIQGTAIDDQQRPLANATVHLRNLDLKTVEQTTAANQRGEFSFTVVPDAPYVVEIANKAGQVIALSDVVVARRGEIASALVTVSREAQAAASVVGAATRSMMSTTGVTALSTLEAAAPEKPSIAEKPPVSPER